MKKIRFLVLTVILAAALLGCATSPASTARQSVFFDGFWVLPNNQVMYVERNAFVLFDLDNAVINSGIFLYNDTHLVLNIDVDSYADFEYTRVSSNMNVKSLGGNEFANGVWRKDPNLYFEHGGKNPIEGYWENTEGDYIRILHIMPDGWGYQYICDKNMEMDMKNEVKYSGISPKEIIITASLPIDGDMVTLDLPFGVIYDRNAIRIGMGENTSGYLRYFKR